MWIEMLKTYIGRASHSCFLAGHKYDLPAATIQRLPGAMYRHCPAPWDAKKAKGKKVKNQKQTKPAGPPARSKQQTTPRDKQLKPGYKTK